MTMLDASRSRNDAEPPRSIADSGGSLLPGDAPAPAPGTRVATVNPNLPAHPYPYGRKGAYETSVLDGPVDLHATFLEYWRILYRRKWLILGILAATVGLGMAYTLMMTPLYSAITRLQIDRSVARVVDTGQTSPSTEADAYDFLKTQFELLQSRALAERVASNLKLADDADFFKQRGGSVFGAAMRLLGRSPQAEATGEKAANTNAAAKVVLGNRTVKPVQGARLVDIIYTDPNPVRAQAISIGLGQAYIAANLDKRFEANSYAKTFLEDQIKQLKLRLEEADRNLIEFSEREQMVIVTEKSSIAENNLAAANSALGTLVSERIKNEQLWKQVSSADAISLPQFLTNQVVAGFRDRRNLLVTEYQEKLQTFKPSYPAMMEISQKIKEIDRQLVNEVATIKNAHKGAFENSVSQEEEMKQRIEMLRTEVLDLQKRSLQYNLLKREVDSNKSLYDGLLTRFKEVDVAGGLGTNNVFIVDRAELPRSPSSPNFSRAFLFSMILGLGGGIMVAYVLSRLDDTYVSPEEVERTTGLTTLGVIPKSQEEGGAERELSDPQSAMSEAYRSLCTALQFATESGLPKSLSLTSASPAEGKSLTSIAVARHFSMLGLKVLLVDADMRNPSLHKKLDLPNGTGLSNYLTGACRPPEAFQQTGAPNLTFMCAGPLPPNAADLLSGARMASLLSVGLEVFDFIVVDGPPVMEIADAPILASTVAATVFVVGAGQARPAMVRSALRRLQHSRSPVIGAVLTKFNARVAGYGYGYGYGGSYGYGYSYGKKGTAVSGAQEPAVAAPTVNLAGPVAAEPGR
jgi:polysaccharide biosynthesis transport protein